MSRATFAAFVIFALIPHAPAQAGPVYPGYAYDYRNGEYVPAPRVPPPLAYVPVYPAPPPVAYAAPPETPPSGWVYARPANCGLYRYWDGRACLDARYDPPPLGE